MSNYDVGGNKYSAPDLLDGLGESDKKRPIALIIGGAGCFIRDGESDQRLFQVVLVSESGRLACTQS